MTWVSFDDSYTEQAVWDGLTHDVRWHYHALVELACRLGLWDGRIPASRAARASDVPNPPAAVAALVAVGLLAVEPDGTVVIAEIDHHVPPEGQRPDKLLPRKRRNQREYRRRQCEAGNHSKDCPTGTCPARGRVTERVTGNAGTGRDGTGRVGKNAVRDDEEEHRIPEWNCGCEHPRQSVDEDGCLRCWSCGQVAS